MGILSEEQIRNLCLPRDMNLSLTAPLCLGTAIELQDTALALWKVAKAAEEIWEALYSLDKDCTSYGVATKYVAALETALSALGEKGRGK